MSCGDARFQDTAGPYLLGLLDEAERAAYDRHVEVCPECRASLESLRPVLAALATVPQDDTSELGRAEPYAVPDTLLPGLLARAARRNRLRRMTIGALGIVAAAALVAVAVLVGHGQESTGPEQAGSHRLVMTPSHDTPVRATAQLKAMPWGTQITLRCHYESGGYADDGVDRAAAYTLQIDGAQGTAHDLGSWNVGAGTDTVFTSGTALKTAQIKQIEVIGPDGSVLLTANG